MTEIIQPVRTLALVGMPGAGKTLCAKHLEQRGFFQFRFGSIVENEVVRRGLPVTPDNERIVREEFRANEGMDVMAKRALPHLREALKSHPVIIIDGLYSFSEYRWLHNQDGMNMLVVAVVASRALRYQRLSERTIRPLTHAEAERRDWQEIEMLEKGGPIAIADYTLVNDGEEADMTAGLDKLLLKLDLHP